MATDVLSPSPASTPTPEPSSESPSELPTRPKPRDRIPSYAQNRMSSYSQRTSRSRPQSNAFPQYKSSLDYSAVRDFAYPTFHPLHYGAPPEPPSGTTTPGSEWNGGRRLSDPESGANSTGSWGAGPWGGDGVMFGDPEFAEESGPAPLPATSFGDDGASESEEATSSRSSSSSERKHRKSKSYTSISDYERGRRRESAGYRRSRTSQDGGSSDMFLFTGQPSDPAGRDALRQSRGYAVSTGPAGQTSENGGPRRDSHFQTMLPPRTYPAGNTNNTNSNNMEGGPVQERTSPIDPDNDMPLDSEPINDLPTSPQRQSIGPEDEELYAGRSLALYSFEPENSNELRLREGQVIMVSYRHGQGWLVAEDPESGEQGLVPEEYVRLLSELPHYDEATGTFIDPEEADADADAEQEEEEEMGEEEEEEGSELPDGSLALSESDRVHRRPSGGEGMMKETRIDEAYSTADLEEGGVMMKKLSR